MASPFVCAINNHLIPQKNRNFVAIVSNILIESSLVKVYNLNINSSLDFSIIL